jgi:hypothetical protein
VDEEDQTENQEPGDEVACRVEEVELIIHGVKKQERDAIHERRFTDDLGKNHEANAAKVRNE